MPGHHNVTGQTVTCERNENILTISDLSDSDSGHNREVMSKLHLAFKLQDGELHELCHLLWCCNDIDQIQKFAPFLANDNWPRKVERRQFTKVFSTAVLSLFYSPDSPILFCFRTIIPSSPNCDPGETATIVIRGAIIKHPRFTEVSLSSDNDQTKPITLHIWDAVSKVSPYDMTRKRHPSGIRPLGTEMAAGRIFINYRRGDNPGFAPLLFERLKAVTDKVFMDVASLGEANDFAQGLRREVEDSDLYAFIKAHFNIGTIGDLDQEKISLSAAITKVAAKSAATFTTYDGIDKAVDIQIVKSPAFFMARKDNPLIITLMEEGGQPLLTWFEHMLSISGRDAMVSSRNERDFIEVEIVGVKPIIVPEEKAQRTVPATGHWPPRYQLLRVARETSETCFWIGNLITDDSPPRCQLQITVHKVSNRCRGRFWTGALSSDSVDSYKSMKATSKMANSVPACFLTGVSITNNALTEYEAVKVICEKDNSCDVFRIGWALTKKSSNKYLSKKASEGRYDLHNTNDWVQLSLENELVSSWVLPAEPILGVPLVKTTRK